MGGSSSKAEAGDPEAMQAWMKSKQELNSETTFIADGGKTIAKKDLPNYMFETDPRSAIQPCEKEKEAVRKCLTLQRGKECEDLLDHYNKCEAKYFTKDRINDLVKIEMRERNEKS